MSTDTANRFDRIVAIFIQLQSARVVKAQDLADRFGVSLRTIYRDVRSLESAGVPIIGEAGVGYSIMEGYRLPPVMFTQEEARSFVAAEKLMQKFGDKTLRSYHQSAIYKVRSVLRGLAKDHVDALDAQIWVNVDKELFNEQTPDALNILFESIAEKKQVALRYHSVFADGSTSRLIEPVNMFNENSYWYMLAYCHLRKNYRQFRIDRILEIRRTDAPFHKDHTGKLDAPKNTKPAQEKVCVVIRVDKGTVPYIRASRKYYGFVSEKPVGDKVEMTFLTSDVQDGLSRWYLMFCDHAEVVVPESFRKTVNKLLEKGKERLNTATT